MVWICIYGASLHLQVLNPRVIRSKRDENSLFRQLPLLPVTCLITQLPHHASHLSPSPCPFVVSFKKTHPLIWRRPHHSQNLLCSSFFFFSLPLLPVTSKISRFLCCTWQPLIHQLLLFSPETGRAFFSCCHHTPPSLLLWKPALLDTHTHTHGYIPLSLIGTR